MCRAICQGPLRNWQANFTKAGPGTKTLPGGIAGPPSGTIALDPMHPSLLPYHPERDVYRLLQVDCTASSEEISAACRRLARTFHPDRNRSPRAHEEMGVINAVRDMLTDPWERAAYDRARSRFLSGWTPGAVAAKRQATTGPALGDPSPSAARLGGRSAWLRGRSLPAVVERTLRALVAAFRAAIGQLGATRCPSCEGLVEAAYLYCASCGTRLRRVPRLDFS